MFDISIIFCWEFLIVAIASSAVVTILKMMSDRCSIHFMDNKWVNMIMALVPALFAMLFALAIHPSQVSTIPQCLVWGLVPGLAAAIGWKIFKSIMATKIGVGVGVDVDELLEKKHEINDKQDKIDVKQDKVDIEQKAVDKLIEEKLIEDDSTKKEPK